MFSLLQLLVYFKFYVDLLLWFSLSFEFSSLSKYSCRYIPLSMMWFILNCTRRCHTIIVRNRSINGLSRMAMLRSLKKAFYLKQVWMCRWNICDFCVCFRKIMNDVNKLKIMTPYLFPQNHSIKYIECKIMT